MFSSPRSSDRSTLRARSRLLRALTEFAPHAVVLMDHLPGRPDLPLFESYASWFAALRAWLPRALTPSRVRVSEVSPGIWCSPGLSNVFMIPTSQGRVIINAGLGKGAPLGTGRYDAKPWVVASPILTTSRCPGKGR